MSTETIKQLRRRVLHAAGVLAGLHEAGEIFNHLCAPANVDAHAAWRKLSDRAACAKRDHDQAEDDLAAELARA